MIDEEIIKALGYYNIQYVGTGFFAHVYKGDKKDLTHAIKMPRKFPGRSRRRDSSNHIIAENEVLQRLQGIDLVAQYRDFYDSLRLKQELLVSDVSDDTVVLIREYVKGKTLDKASNNIDKKYRQALKDTVTQIHKSGFVNLDIYPGKNIIINLMGIPYIIDLGFAQTKDDYLTTDDFENAKSRDFKSLDRLLSEY